MPADRTPILKRVLDPYDRISEVLFGLIMVLTFTGSLSIAEAGRDDARTMLIGALGCNLAWGVIDGVLYLMGCLAERNRDRVLLRAARDPAAAVATQRKLAATLPPVVASVLEPEDWEKLQRRLQELPEPAGRVRLERDDWLGGLAVLLLVFLATLPVVVPFVLISNARLALRLSNVVAIVLLFGTGCAFGQQVGWSRWKSGLAMVGLGIFLVLLTMALGG